MPQLRRRRDANYGDIRDGALPFEALARADPVEPAQYHVQEDDGRLCPRASSMPFGPSGVEMTSNPASVSTELTNSQKAGSSSMTKIGVSALRPPRGMSQPRGKCKPDARGALSTDLEPLTLLAR